MSPQFEIRLQGQLDDRWSEWFEPMSISPRADGTTVLTGPMVDQAALQGLLRRVADLGLALVSVNTVEPKPAE